MNSSYSTILFDFDGTLIPSLDFWLTAFHYAFAKFELKLSDNDVVKRCFYRSFRDVVSEFKLPCPIEFGQLVYEGLHQSFEDASLFAGVRETLTNCADENIKLAIVTSSPRSVVEKTLAKLNIGSFFSVLITADEVENFKPDPEPVLLALQKLGGKSTDSLIIGDSTADILAAKSACVSAGLFFPDIHNKFYDFKKLIEAEPHFVFHQYNELDKHIFATDKRN